MTDKEKLEKLKKLADAMYYAVANLGPTVGSGEHLRKTMEEYHKFIIHEYYKEELISEDLEQTIDTYLVTYFCGELEKQEWPFLKKMAIYFANWQKQQMMKESIDGEIQFGTVKVQKGDIKEAVKSLGEGEKVKVILIKED